MSRVRIDPDIQFQISVDQEALALIQAALAGAVDMASQSQATPLKAIYEVFTAAVKSIQQYNFEFNRVGLPVASEGTEQKKKKEGV